MVKTLEKYVAVTKDKRNKCEELFLPAFKKASKDTISRWVRAFLADRGIGKENEKKG